MAAALNCVPDDQDPQWYDDFWRATASRLNRLRIRLNPNNLETAARYITNMRVITTGLGKAGIAARKAAATFCSLGIPAVYLDPATAAHGDLGVVQHTDIILAFTKSGKTREVLETLNRLNNKKIIITGGNATALRLLGCYVIDFGDIREAGYLGLAPTTSFLAMVIISDMLASLASTAKGWTITDFGRVHHAGYLGAKARQLQQFDKDKQCQKKKR